MSRPQSLTRWSFLAALSVFVCASAPAAERPNILWITSEDNGCYLGCYGDKNALTPNIDALAARGVRFTKCYANSPVCAVARSSWILGVPAPSVGMQHMRSRYRIPKKFVPLPVLMQKAGYYTTNRSKTDYNTTSFGKGGKAIWDECGDEAHYRNRKEGQPFFAVFNLGDTHEGQIFPETVKREVKKGRLPKEPRVKAEDIVLPPYQARTKETVNDWRRVYDKLSLMDERFGALIKELQEEGEAENTIIVYHSDHGGITLRTKRFLQDSGTRVPLIVHVPEKWKQWAPGEPGTASDRLVQFLDLPKTFLTLAGATPPDYMYGRVFFGEKVEPAPETVFLFTNRFDESPDMTRGVTDGRWKYIRNYEPDRPRYQMLEYPWRQLGQQSQWREYKAGKLNEVQAAFYQDQPAEELYDTSNDPHEVRNLAADPEYAARLASLKGKLRRSILETRDLGFLPEPLMASIEKKGAMTVYDYASQGDNYPLGQILDLLERVPGRKGEALPDEEESDLVRRVLGEQNSTLRYWSAVALRILQPDSVDTRLALGSALADPDPGVRVVVATALKDKTALLQEARNAETDIHAMWALDGIKMLDAPDALDGVPRKDVVKGEYSGRVFHLLKAGGSLHQPPK